MLIPLLVLSTGCSGALVREQSESFPDMVELDDGGWIALFAVYVGVNAAGRDLRTELEMNVGGFLEEGLAIDAELLSGAEAVPTFEPGSHTGDLAIVHEPDFGACEGLAYSEGADGGCDATFTGVVTLGADAAPRIGFILRSFDDNGTADADAVALTLSVSELRAE